jgi:predicted PolB exonuclease-like 3'-5' exonuclease
MYFIDIETVPAFRSLEEADKRTQELFIKKFQHEIAERVEKLAPASVMGSRGQAMIREEVAQSIYIEKAGFLAEFNKIVCISVGTWLAKNSDRTERELYVKNIIGEERDILTTLSRVLEKADGLCAHFGKGFDYPVLARKYLINNLPLPFILNTKGLKPWEINLVDTQELWKFGDLRHSCSLDLLAHIFGLPSPKENMDGSMVAPYFYSGRIDEIAQYCEADVRTLAAVYERMK